jgi:hypothetical protein
MLGLSAFESVMFKLSATSVRPSRWVSGHLAVAALAIAGAAAVAMGGSSDLRSAGIDGWRAYIVAAILSAVAWLLSTALVHGQLARSAGPRSPGWLAMSGASDVVVAAIAGFLLLQGHASPLALAGLWKLCPTLLAVAALSAAVLLASAYGALQQSHGQRLLSGIDVRWRMAVVIGLLISLGLLAARPMPAGVQSRSSTVQSRR